MPLSVCGVAAAHGARGGPGGAVRTGRVGGHAGWGSASAAPDLVGGGDFCFENSVYRFYDSLAISILSLACISAVSSLPSLSFVLFPSSF